MDGYVVWEADKVGPKICVCVWRGVSNYRHYAAMYWDGKDLGKKLFFFVLPYLVLRELGF